MPAGPSISKGDVAAYYPGCGYSHSRCTSNPDRGRQTEDSDRLGRSVGAWGGASRPGDPLAAAQRPIFGCIRVALSVA